MMGSNINIFSFYFSTSTKEPGCQGNGGTGEDHAKEGFTTFDEGIGE
jgi:hypothetical protein